jgi:hypothetical protein
MKKVLLALAVLGTIFLTACEKDNSLEPAEKVLLKSDKSLMCRGCGDWDIVTESFSSSTDTVAAQDGRSSGKGRGR